MPTLFAKRHLMRWTLRALLASITVFAILTSVILHRYRLQTDAISTVTSHGGIAIHPWEFVGFGDLWEKNAFRSQTFGETILSLWNKQVTSVKFDMPNYDLELNDALRNLPNLSQIRVRGVENGNDLQVLKEQFPKIEIFDEDEFLRSVIH